MNPFLCKLCKRLNDAIAAKSWALFASQSNDQDIWAAEADQESVKDAYACWEVDPAEGLTKFRALAEGGSVWSMSCVGYAFETGCGVSIDKTEAADWYRRAYEHGSDRGMVYLGLLYLKTGQLAKAEETLRVGAARDLAAAKSHLALVYLKGPTRRENLAEARILLEQASERGDYSAAIALANLLVRGRFGFFRIPTGIRLFVSMLKRVDTLVGNDKM